MQKLKLAVSNPKSAPSNGRLVRRSTTIDNVTEIVRDESNAEVIAALEQMLSKARCGEFAGMVAAFVKDDGACTYMLSGVALDSPAIAGEVTDKLKVKFS